MAAYSIQDINVAKSFLRDCLKFLDCYDWLIDAFIIDFFVDSLWERLPTSWRFVLDRLDVDKLPVLLDDSQRIPNEVWPLSLLCFRKLSCKVLRFSRVSNEQDDDCVDEGMTHVFRKHVKPKKRHEVVRLSRAIADVCNKMNCRRVIDFGGGQGHLARRLAFAYGLDVVTLDAEDPLVTRARKFDSEVVSLRAKKLSTDENGSVQLGVLSDSSEPKHLHTSVSSDRNFSEITRLVWKEEGNSNERGEKAGNLNTDGIVVVGLHACGDLGPAVLRIFAHNDTCSAAVLASCCYMKMSEESHPMSDFMKLFRPFSYRARELACHATETYAETLSGNSVFSDAAVSLRVHCFRAVLEHCIVLKWPHMRRSQLRSVKHFANMEFSKYVSMALERFPIKGVRAEELIENVENVEELLSQWGRINVFFTLRAAVAPVIETCLLLDRAIYLLERGFDVEIKALFDPSVSPRNLVIISRR